MGRGRISRAFVRRGGRVLRVICALRGMLTQMEIVSRTHALTTTVTATELATVVHARALQDTREQIVTRVLMGMGIMTVTAYVQHAIIISIQTQTNAFVMPDIREQTATPILTGALQTHVKTGLNAQTKLTATSANA